MKDHDEYGGRKLIPIGSAKGKKERIYSDNEEMSVLHQASDVEGGSSVLLSGMNSVREGGDYNKPKRKINWKRLNANNPSIPPLPN